MNNTISFSNSNPSFGVKVDLVEIAGKLKSKNPESIKHYIETSTKDFPSDIFYIQNMGNGGISMILTESRGITERYLDLPASEFKKLLKTTKSNIEQTFGVACKALKEALKIDVQNAKKLDKAIKKGAIIEGTMRQDSLVKKSDKEAKELVEFLLKDDPVLSKATFN